MPWSLQYFSAILLLHIQCNSLASESVEDCLSAIAVKYPAQHFTVLTLLCDSVLCT